MAVELGSLEEGVTLYYLTEVIENRDRVIERYIVEEAEHEYIIMASQAEEELYMIINTEDDKDLFEYSLFYSLEDMAKVYSRELSKDICFCCIGLLEPYWNDNT